MRRFATVLAFALIVAACSSDDGGSTTVTTAAQTTTSASTSTAATTTTTQAATTTETDAPPLPEPAGATGLGDPYFPELGNGGYDVEHYFIDIAVDPETAAIEAVTTIEATATETLATFDLDLLGLDVLSVEVDGTAADYRREGPELRISPTGGIVAGEDFEVTVTYSGTPQPIQLVSVGVEFGWTKTPEGVYVAAEPDGSRTWFPSNDHPSDKATFTFRITVPKPYTAVANGELIDVADNGDSRSFTWDLQSRTATYLATIAVGEYERFESEGPDGILIRDYLPTSFNGTIPSAFDITAEAMELYTDWFGPYPFDRYGHVVVYDLGGALETQTMSLMGNRALFDDIVVHELSHQWWGDSVTIASWQDIWLNEGFATFAEFLWTEHRRGTEAMLDDIQDRHDSLSSIGHFPISDPKETQLFGPAVYWRGGMTLHALRVEVGDDTLKEIFHTYFQRYEDSTVTTQDFIDVAEEVSGRDLTDLFDTWLNTSALPELP